MYFPRRRVELVYDHSQFVKSGKCNDGVIAAIRSILGQVLDMLREWNVIFYERLKVSTVFRDVTYHVLSVSAVGMVVTIELVGQGTKQTVAISNHLTNLETHYC